MSETPRSRPVVVVGAGVIGLTAAVRLAEAGHPVEIWTRELPEDTTSAVAAAIWFPYAAGPAAAVARWARRTHAELMALSTAAGSGVELTDGCCVFAGPEPEHAARRDLLRPQPVPPAELPRGCRSGFTFRAPVCVMPLYLAYLRRRLAAAGGVMRQRTIRFWAEPAAVAPLVVNSTGLGARELAADRSLYPIRGQVVRIARAGISRAWIADDAPGGLTYVVPRTAAGDCILGGTAEMGVGDTAVDATEAAAIRQRCAVLEPAAAEAVVRDVRVGLRPGRASVRLEAERLPGGATVVHCYGHGGAGVTLSWGCADDVVRVCAGDL